MHSPRTLIAYINARPATQPRTRKVKLVPALVRQDRPAT